ncbi:hypothetical protein KIPB_001128 [Kipferlia bialata]|uniref:PPi-type phosphoenolpyruvate carboxykinase lobe 2 domain-containing protein n=1 Tax=Kipferlia bialata TaxID=797122 RepID=A0A9K3CQ96_9EUKA|nr:hypothetical protein KIPB_001128 [Kipferlia bialata]|eukprot:g1128.t1
MNRPTTPRGTPIQAGTPGPATPTTPGANLKTEPIAESSFHVCHTAQDDHTEYLADRLGFVADPEERDAHGTLLQESVALSLQAAGITVPATHLGEQLSAVSKALLKRLAAQGAQLETRHPPADVRIQTALESALEGVTDNVPTLPTSTVFLDRCGMARVLALPLKEDRFENEYMSVYRTAQGVLVNPEHDRRTTKGVFHIVESGIPVPSDKIAVPKVAWANLLHHALNPPEELLQVPYTSSLPGPKGKAWASLLLTPCVSPGVWGFQAEKKMEIRAFAPGSLVSCLDFIEHVFGNGGDPWLPENDLMLDPIHFAGTTGCIIFAPHLRKITKVQAGLPKYEDALPAQQRSGMCYKDESELYHNGSPFKLVYREGGSIITIIADTYLGYAKKECKGMLSYAANRLGFCEEEHAGGAIVESSHMLGQNFYADSRIRRITKPFSNTKAMLGPIIDYDEKLGCCFDKKYGKAICYTPETLRMSIENRSANWVHPVTGELVETKLRANTCYMMPNGYTVEMVKNSKTKVWQLIGTSPRALFCHKPATVSGGGKSEISKPIEGAIVYSSYYVNDFKELIADTKAILAKDFYPRFNEGFRQDERENNQSRAILSDERSLGSVIKLLTVDEIKYTPEYNDWLRSLSIEARTFVLTLKALYKKDWGANWEAKFGVDIVNGQPGHQLLYKSRLMRAGYLRVGITPDGSWRNFLLRPDFSPSQKHQMEDDISATITVPAWCDTSAHPSSIGHPVALKMVSNPEFRFFQRPDDAIVPGFDVEAERDLSNIGGNALIANFEPITKDEMKVMAQDVINVDKFTPPVQKLIALQASEEATDELCVVSNRPRIVDGKPTKNVRYLQNRPEWTNPMKTYRAEVCGRLERGVTLDTPLNCPVGLVLPGRRLNPSSGGNRPLAVYSALHYQELPELFADIMASPSGKSPSTTGAGIEGPLTKGPFNCMPAVLDLNAALLSLIMTGDPCYTTAAGYIGSQFRVDHDISLLIPEVMARMSEKERRPEFLIDHGYLEKIEDFEHEGKLVKASRLGYRMTRKMVSVFFSRVFANTDGLFPESALRPEKQSMDEFIAGLEHVIECQETVASQLLESGAVFDAIEPLKAIIYCVATGSYNGKTIDHPEIRKLFTRDYVMASAWYHEMLVAKQRFDATRLQDGMSYLSSFMAGSGCGATCQRLNLKNRYSVLNKRLQLVRSPEYVDLIRGTTGLSKVSHL